MLKSIEHWHCGWHFKHLNDLIDTRPKNAEPDNRRIWNETDQWKSCYIHSKLNGIVFAACISFFSIGVCVRDARCVMCSFASIFLSFSVYFVFFLLCIRLVLDTKTLSLNWLREWTMQIYLQIIFIAWLYWTETMWRSVFVRCSEFTETKPWGLHLLHSRPRERETEFKYI